MEGARRCHIQGQGVSIRYWMQSPKVFSRTTSEGVNGCFFSPFTLKSLTFKFCLEGLSSFVIQVSQTSGFTRMGVGDGDVDVGMGKEYAGQRVEYQRASSLYLFCKVHMISGPQFLSCLARNHCRLWFCLLPPSLTKALRKCCNFKMMVIQKRSWE